MFYLSNLYVQFTWMFLLSFPVGDRFEFRRNLNGLGRSIGASWTRLLALSTKNADRATSLYVWDFIVLFTDKVMTDFGDQYFKLQPLYVHWLLICFRMNHLLFNTKIIALATSVDPVMTRQNEKIKLKWTKLMTDFGHRYFKLQPLNVHRL